MKLDKLLLKTQATVDTLRAKVKVAQLFQVGKLYHVDYMQGTWEPASGKYIQAQAHMLGVLKGYNYSEQGVRVSIAFAVLTDSIPKRDREITKSGEYSMSYCLPTDLVLGGSPIPARYRGEFSGIHEVALDDLILYTNDPLQTGSYKKYLSGMKVPGHRAQRTT